MQWSSFRSPAVGGLTCTTASRHELTEETACRVCLEAKTCYVAAYTDYTC